MPYVKPGIYTQEINLSHKIPDMEPLPEMILNIVKQRIEEKPRKLKARWTLEVAKDLKKDFDDPIIRCPKCGVNPAEDCGYLSHDPWNGDYDCEAPDNVEADLMCEYCHHSHCSLCRLKETYNFKEEEFDV
jgi:hypothetical protein